MNLWTVIGQLLTPLLLAILALVVTRAARAVDKRRAHKPIEEQSAETGHQQAILQECMEKLGAMRVYLTKLHNGDNFDDGSSIARKSRAVEVVRDGVSYESIRNSGILISTVREEMDLVLEKGSSWFVTADLPLSNFRATSRRAGVVAGARCAVHKAGKTVGYLGADFDHAEKPANIDVLCEYAKWFEKTL